MKFHGIKMLLNEIPSCKKSQYRPKPYESIAGDINVKIDI